MRFVIDPGQFDRFGVIPSNSFDKALNSRIKVEYQAAGVPLPIMLCSQKKDATRNPRVTEAILNAV